MAVAGPIDRASYGSTGGSEAHASASGRFQLLVGLLDFFETNFGHFAELFAQMRHLVGMILAYQLAVCLFELLLTGTVSDPQDVVGIFRAGRRFLSRLPLLPPAAASAVSALMA